MNTKITLIDLQIGWRLLFVNLHSLSKKVLFFWTLKIVRATFLQYFTECKYESTILYFFSIKLISSMQWCPSTDIKSDNKQQAVGENKCPPPCLSDIFNKEEKIFFFISYYVSSTIKKLFSTYQKGKVYLLYLCLEPKLAIPFLPLMDYWDLMKWFIC